jgi:hypothetical protein
MTCIGFPSGIPMHLSAHQPEQQLATCGRLNLGCCHEGDSQSGSSERRSRPVTIFCNGLSSLAHLGRNFGEVRRIYSNLSLGALELRWVVKQIQLGQFDPARLLTYVLSRLIESRAVDQTVSKSGANTTDADQAQLARSPARAAGEILKAAERRWPSRYY